MFQLIAVGKRALQVTEKQIETTSNNISNVNTEGYSRQRVIQESGMPLELAYASIGTGVYIQSIERMRDEMLDTNYRESMTGLGYWDKRSGILEKLETTLNEPSDYGLSNKINQFFSSWDSLASSPGSETYRMDLLNNAEQMTTGFNSLYDNLASYIKSVDDELISSVNRVNEIAQQLADLSQDISFTEGQASVPNDLLDKYDLLIDELSKYGNVVVKNKDYGQKAIYFGTDVIVDGASARKIGFEDVTTNGVGVHNLLWDNNGDFINGLNNGELVSLIDLRDSVISGYLDDLDLIADTIKEKVNELHLTGYDNTANKEKGHLFFDEKSSGAKDFSVNSIIADDPNKIATSLSGEIGDNEIALQIANLRSSLSIDNKTSITEAYANLVYKIGGDSANTKSKQENQQQITTQVDEFRDSVKGVSLNEETADLIKYQQMYQAAAKIISLADEMLKVILGLV
jgi:flagellar hook-associated protein 1 FlgK